MIAVYVVNGCYQCNGQLPFCCHNDIIAVDDDDQFLCAFCCRLTYYQSDVIHDANEVVIDDTDAVTDGLLSILYA